MPFSGTSEFVSAIPVLPALDVGKAVSFYTKHLGFARRFVFEDYAGLNRGPVEIHLWLCNDPRIGLSTNCRIRVTGIEGLYEHSLRQGIVHPNGALLDKPWGTREFTVVDLTGNAITFVQGGQRA